MPASHQGAIHIVGAQLLKVKNITLVFVSEKLKKNKKSDGRNRVKWEKAGERGHSTSKLAVWVEE